jgi:hypothetical protein
MMDDDDDVVYWLEMMMTWGPGFDWAHAIRRLYCIQQHRLRLRLAAYVFSTRYCAGHSNGPGEKTYMSAQEKKKYMSAQKKKGVPIRDAVELHVNWARVFFFFCADMYVFFFCTHVCGRVHLNVTHSTLSTYTTQLCVR